MLQKKLMKSGHQILPNMHKSPSTLSNKITNSLKSLELALRALPCYAVLNNDERKSLHYYAKEYLTGIVSPDALVLALTQLLDSPIKVGVDF